MKRNYKSVPDFALSISMIFIVLFETFHPQCGFFFGTRGTMFKNIARGHNIEVLSLNSLILLISESKD